MYVGVLAEETRAVIGRHPDVGMAVAHRYTRGNSLAVLLSKSIERKFKKNRNELIIRIQYLQYDM